MRNSVRATVDTCDGAVLYIADPKDPLIRTWARAFPDLFTPMERMPADLRPRAPRTVRLQAECGIYTCGTRRSLQQGPLDHSRLTYDGRDHEMEPYFTIRGSQARRLRGSCCSQVQPPPAGTT
jgi:hypothetical protein